MMYTLILLAGFDLKGEDLMFLIFFVIMIIIGPIVIGLACIFLKDLLE